MQYTQLLWQWTPHTKLLVVDNQSAHDLLEIYVFNKSPFETAQVVLLKFTHQVYLFRLSIGTSMCLVRMHVKVLKFTGQGYFLKFTCKFYPPII